MLLVETEHAAHQADGKLLGPNVVQVDLPRVGVAAQDLPGPLPNPRPFEVDGARREGPRDQLTQTHMLRPVQVGEHVLPPIDEGAAIDLARNQGESVADDAGIGGERLYVGVA